MAFVFEQKLEFLNAQPGPKPAAVDKPVVVEKPPAPKETPVGGKDEWISEKSSEAFRNELIGLLRSSPPLSNEDIVAFVDVRSIFILGMK